MIRRHPWAMLAVAGAAGAALLLIVKYRVVGLAAWDAALHPHRLPCDTGDER